jgi:quercetin dioxygenase-like cupin family protein
MTAYDRRTRRTGLVLTLAVIALAAVPSLGSAQEPVQPARDTTPKRSRVVFAHALAPLDGSHLKATIVEVRYGPGESSPAHSHPCPVIGYVIEGALRTQVQGEPAVVYHAGQSFYENPDQGHLVSANASRTDSLRFLAYFTCDRDTPLSVAAPSGHR